MVWGSVFSFIFDVLQRLAPPEYGNFRTIRDFCRVFDRTEPVGDLMNELPRSKLRGINMGG